MGIKIYMGDENKSMRTLYDYFCKKIKELENLNKTNRSLNTIIENNEEARKFIQEITFSRENIFEKSDEALLNDDNENRAIHSVCVFLLGLTVGKFCNLFNLCGDVISHEEIRCFEPNPDIIKYRLWILVSVLHDYGYYSPKTFEENADLKKCHPYILSDDLDINCSCPFFTQYSKYHDKVLKLSYTDIENYYNYAQKLHESKGDKEKNDHGIIGGTEIFKKQLESYRARLEKQEIEPRVFKKNILYYKTACLTVCQHNIFKSSDEETDENYKRYDLNSLLSTSGYSVGTDTPLLALLVLVDTIECIKSFSKIGDKTNLQPKKILEKIKICVTKDRMCLNFENLANYANCANLCNKLIDNICNLKSWTDFDVETSTNSKYRFSIVHK